MSLVYAKKSDEIWNARRVFLHASEVCNTYYLMYSASSFMWLRVYQSLCTYAVQLDLV